MFGTVKRKLKEKEDATERLREQEETARVYADFVKSFQVEDGGIKSFVRGGIIDPNKSLSEEHPASASSSSSSSSSSSKSKIYRPVASKKPLWVPPSTDGSSLPSSASSSSSSPSSSSSSASSRDPSCIGTSAVPSTSPSSTTPSSRSELSAGQKCSDSSGPGPTVCSASSNKGQRTTKDIDLFLEEIKRKQELLNQRKELRQVADNSNEEIERSDAKRKLELIESQTKGKGSIPGLVEAEETTNLYLGNLAPEITEEYLCQQFGKYGKVASVKIMYPRNDSSAADGDRPGRRSLCGFCSFEERANAQVAKDNLDGTEMLGQVIRIGWGKAVSKPIVSPTPLSVGVGALSGVPLSMSRVKSGLSGFSDLPPDGLQEQHLKGAIKVRVPKDKRQKAIIDLVAQYVSEDGHPMEQAIVERYGDDPLYKFISDIDSDDGRYYRWRAYAFSQGDSLKAWRVESFLMFFGGCEWIPPGKDHFPETRERKSIFSQNPDPDASSSGHAEHLKGSKRLDDETRDELEDRLRNLSRDRRSVSETMVLCLDHAEAALEISECLTESLTIEKTPIDPKIARLYLLSDLLHNSCCSKQAAWAFRGAIERFLPEIFNHHNKVLKSLNGRLTIQAFKDRVMKVLRAWESWSIYTPLFTKGLEATFLKDEKLLQGVFSEAAAPLPSDSPLVDPLVDGRPFDVTVMSVELLSRYPYWLRESILEWNSLDLTNLERLCRRKGLSVSPESDQMADQVHQQQLQQHSVNLNSNSSSAQTAATTTCSSNNNYINNSFNNSSNSNNNNETNLNNSYINKERFGIGSSSSNTAAATIMNDEESAGAAAAGPDEISDAHDVGTASHVGASPVGLKFKAPSYNGMRQLLIQRLIECEAFWRNRQIQNAKAFSVLDNKTNVSDDLPLINTRELIQSVLADVMNKSSKAPQVSENGDSSGFSLSNEFSTSVVEPSRLFGYMRSGIGSSSVVINNQSDYNDDSDDIFSKAQ